MTKQRKEIYEILKKSNKPLSAEIIFEMLPENFMNLSTVYRTLEYFDQNFLVLKFFFNGKSHYFLNNDEHHHYSICTNCLSMHSIECHLSETINELKLNQNFLVTNHEMTIYGLCENCQ